MPHFNTHPLGKRPVFMDDNARPHRSRAVIEYLRSILVSTVFFACLQPGFGHYRTSMGRKVRERTPLVQIL